MYPSAGQLLASWPLVRDPAQRLGRPSQPSARPKEKTIIAAIYPNNCSCPIAQGATNVPFKNQNGLIIPFFLKNADTLNLHKKKPGGALGRPAHVMGTLLGHEWPHPPLAGRGRLVYFSPARPSLDPAGFPVTSIMMFSFRQTRAGIQSAPRHPPCPWCLCRALLPLCPLAWVLTTAAQGARPLLSINKARML